MPINNIGPCECCGGLCSCPQVTCTREWSGGMAGTWDIIASCNSSEGVIDNLDRPCCNCPTPGAPGSFSGQQITAPCVQTTGTTGCNCSTCTATWSTVLDNWILSSCAVAGGASNRCTCPTQEKPTPRPSNGYVISNIACSC